ncbi:helix-hairpin-helix domain-containing protein [Methylobacterium sp. J-078]|uniref:helix-hairpin-helix domain-containing protein n=1 Tax=Methylobacterium sp. J-078 TaxID=2836657 RepID=UPI001FBA4FA6|nr:helix-hairpin-helix domain-containing protein [Methylobacterium sp. J-078]MCJ2048016.1 helix-hairpin-helix domain-containing protein [Methylobacterium sp. J-078]
MLSGSAVVRVGILIVAAAILAGLVQLLRPRDSGPVDAPASRTAPETGRAGTQAAVPPAVTRPVSPVAPAPAPQPAPAPAPPAAPPQAAAPQATTPQAITPRASAPPPAVPAPAPNALPPTPTPPNPSPQSVPASPSAGEAAIDSAAESAGPRGIAIVDLNTGSVAELNGLRGGGMIGRAIVQKRPYASVGELLSKRVLSRAVYERIKDQVTVR